MEATVRIYADRMEATGPRGSAEARPDTPYVGRRILVGSFDPALACLRRALAEAGASGRFRKPARLVIEAMEMNEGGLSDVESRCLRELGEAAGAGRVEVR